MGWFYNLLYGEKEKRINELLSQVSGLIDKNAQLEKSNAHLYSVNSEQSDKILKLGEEINRLNDEINILSQSTIKEATSYGKITLQEADAALQKLGISDIHLSDVQYDLTTVSEAKRFAQETKVQFREWKEETHDCDNFSYALMGYWSQGLMSFAFGIAWSSTHAFNIMFDQNKILWVCEPQTNVWTKYSEIRSNPRYKIVSVMM